MRIVKGFFAGDVDFTGRYYRVDLPAAGPPVTTPPILSAALAGPVAMRTVGPLVDIIEISTPGFAFRKGRANMRACGATTLDDLQRLVERARTANAGASIGLSLYVATGEGEGVELWRRLFEDGCYKGLAGEPEEVADAIRAFDRLGVDRITVMPPFEGTAEALAPHLLGVR